MTEIVKNTNHVDEGLARLITKYKTSQNIKDYLTPFLEQCQELENVFFDILEKRRLANAENAQLDLNGDILNVQRGGSTDDDYKALLYTKIAEYNSECTIEDINSIFSNLARADQIILNEYFPATIQMIAINPTPIITDAGVKNAVSAAKAAGVILDSVIYAETGYFGFAEDPNALGFDTGKFAKVL